MVDKNQEIQEFISSLLVEFNTKLRDLEEKQRLLKERVLLIGKNLVELKDEFDKVATELKTDSEIEKTELEKIKSTIRRTLEELDNKARKTELEILERQIRIFQPLSLLEKNAGSE